MEASTFFIVAEPPIAIEKWGRVVFETTSSSLSV
jgi:hypothetical protein